MTLLSFAALAAYLVASVAFVLDVWRPNERSMNVAIKALGLGAALQALDFVVGALVFSALPVTGFPRSLALLAWTTALAGLAIIVKFRLPLVGALVAPAVSAALGLACAGSGQNHGALPEALRSAWLPVHVTLAFLGEALFVIAAGVSFLYLIQESRLKAKRPLEIPQSRLPNLEKLDRINYQLLTCGFVLLSLAIVSGAMWAASTWGRFWSWEPVESWSLVLWLLYAALLQSRLAVGLRGRRAARLTIALFAVLLCSYVGINLFNPGKHGGSFG